MKKNMPQGNHKRKRSLSDYMRLLVFHRKSPEAIGRGVSIGLLIGFSPFYGLHFVLAFLLATVLRASKIAAMIVVCISNPLTLVPIYSFTYWIGSRLLSVPAEDHRLQTFMDHCINGLQKHNLHETRLFLHQAFGLGKDVFMPLLVGGLALAAVGIVVGYPATLIVVQRFRAAHSLRLKTRAKRASQLDSE